MRRILFVVAWLAAATASLAAQRSEASRVADSLYAAKDYVHALSAYEQLVQQQASNGSYWYQLGMSAANVKRYERGVTAFATAGSLTGNPAALYNTGAMHARLGHTDSAFVWLTRAINSGINDPNLLRTDEDLASIRGDKRFAALLAGPGPAPTPCVTEPNNRAFDFWAGEWDVTTQGGTSVGKSSVHVVSGGCALLENWTAANGSNGKSLSSYNVIEKRWQQYWIGSGGSVTEYRDSEWNGKSLSFIARPPAGGAPPNAIAKLTFTDMPDGTVRQHGEQSLDQGKSWTTTYDFYYHRRK